MDINEKRFQTIEQDLEILKATHATKEDLATGLASVRVEIANLKFTMLLGAVGAVGATVSLMQLLG